MPPEQRAADNVPGENGSARSRLVSIGSSDSREYPLDKQTVAIGSHPSNDVVLDDTTVSRRHATITRKRGRFELADLGSTNGTLVNGGRVRNTIALKRGDEIKFGSVRFAFIAAGDPIPAPARAARAPSRLGRRLAIAVVMFIAGFAGVRYRSEIGPATSAIAAWISPRRPSSAPSAANTQSASPSEQAKATSTPALSAIPAAAQPEWLRRVNYYRAMVKLPPIVEDPALSSGDRAHTMYIVRNYHDAIEHGGLGAEMHTEDPGSPNFTPEGLEAAKSSDMDVWSMRGVSRDANATSDADKWGSPTWSIDGWMAIPFHRMPILNPRLTSAGFGIYCESGVCAAGLNLLNGSQRKLPAGAAESGPIEFPPDGATVAIRSFGNEWPDPRTNCPGYEPRSGLAITLQLGTWMDTHLGEYSIARENADGSRTTVEACGFDSTSYSNPDGYSQELGRNILKSYGTTVVIPRAPLDKGAKYAVSMSANGKQYDWTFSTRP
ncbi:MAG: FHA domain-containing protein [Candidatus Binatus sp.]|uniref:FHA domain-containing protein n=1 Tax=Candidatus Binatus sp. TaxID=2811406 RepID=UPI003C738274